ncbi:MAG TPA: hypothetical protein ENN31_00975 [Candidatus Vogelbacteria bacterium]|nr:hypothetical protein [Candidatus Vogelbacteria bacterium]
MVTYQEKVNISRRRRRIIFWLKFSSWFIFIASGFLALIYIFNQPQFQIKKIEIYGAQTISSEEVVFKIEDILDSKRFFLIPTRNFLFTPFKKIARNILSSDIHLYQVRISLDGIDTLEVVLEERMPKYLWCRENEDGEGSECFFVDKRGFIFSPAPLLSNSLIPRITGRNFSSPLGQVILPSRYFRNLEDIIGIIRMVLSDNNMTAKISVIEIFNSGDIRLVLEINKEGTGQLYWPIIFYLEQDYKILAEDFAPIFKNQEFINELENNNWQIEYIDLRFGRRIFYKL